MMFGSEAMYHVANCRMDQVTNSAMGKNMIEYWSIFRLIGILKFVVSFHSQQVAMLSVFEYIKIVMGTKLIRNAVLVVWVIVVGEFFRVFARRGSIIGVRISVSVRIIEVLRSSVVSTAFTWICTKVVGS